MNLKTIVKKLGFRLLPVVVLLGFVLMPFSSQPAVQATVPTAGIVCTENSTSTFTLTTKTGYISIPDGNVVFMWGFSEGNKPFQHPSPVLCVREGDTVTVVVKNTFTEPVSIIFPGQENVRANGVPVSPELNVSGVLVSMTNSVQPGASLTYSFVASKPGTYTYLSGSNPAKQVQMGLFGALIVRPAAHPDWAFNKADTRFKPSTEFMTLLSEIDPVMHQAVERNMAFDIRTYKPRYFLINGRAFPDTIAPNGATWLPSQPYGAIARIQPLDAISNPYPALVRLINFASAEIPFHPHGNSGRIIGRDGNLLVGSAGQDLSYDKFSVNLGPGQTWDSLFTWQNVDAYDPVSNPVPVTVPNEQNSTFGELFSGSPYLGNNQPLPPGTLTFNQCGEYYHIAHNHSLQQITSWGITMSGQLTVTRIDPPSPNLCP